MTTVTISLPDSLKDFLEHEVRTKGYGNTSEYVRGLLRQAQEKEANERLESMLLEGLASGEDIPLTQDFWRELKADAARILVQNKTAKKRRKASVVRRKSYTL